MKMLTAYLSKLNPNQRRRLLHWLVILLALSTMAAFPPSNPTAAQSPEPQAMSPRIYLPIVVGAPKGEVFIGLYAQAYWGTTTNDLKLHLQDVDSWASAVGGQRLTIAGNFIDIEDTAFNITNPLDNTWGNGYVQFINLKPRGSYNSRSIADGALDTSLRAWANAYKSWADKGGGRWSFIAPLQEMNGDWVPYGMDPQQYIRAYTHIRQIFAEQKVPANSVRWVFAPNGYSNPGAPAFEAYFPGASQVDVVAFSSYNFGYCAAAVAKGYPRWETAGQIFDPYITRMQTMAPGKPIIVAQTASTSYTASGTPNASAKDQWLKDTYTHLGTRGVAAVIYFNMDKECDWAFYQPSGRKMDGYRQGVANPNYNYLSPASVLAKFPR